MIVGIAFSLQIKQTSATTTCSDTDSGFTYTTKGTISGGIWKTTGRTYADKTDSCNVKGQLQEGFCPDSTHGFYVFKYCDRVVGTDYMCYDGACVLDSDDDDVPDSIDVCSGYDDSEDTDSDGTPNGCDTDDDGDGYSDTDEASAGTDPLDATDYPCGGVYDDFSGSSLDTSLWTESMDSGSAVTGYVDKYYLDTTTQNYHTAQLSAAGSDKGVLLEATREFTEDESLEYDVIYQSRGGNLISRIYLDGDYLEYSGMDAHGYATSGNVGYWNGASEIGDDFGTYHFTVSFGADYAYFEVLRPNATTWTYNWSRQTPPYSYGVATRTGDNGYGEFDYDNFEVTC